MRDNIRPNTLNLLVQEDAPRIAKFRDWLMSNEVPDERKKSIRISLIDLSISLTIAHYSGGSSKADVQVHLLNTIDAFEQGFKWEGFENSYGAYDEMIWMLSLGILCDVELTDFKRITALLKRDGVEDP
ncbi:MAG: PoNe immunity protein domain-containing protein, partial [Flavobacteriales bacterium]